jgi:hypothetical protein
LTLAVERVEPAGLETRMARFGLTLTMRTALGAVRSRTLSKTTTKTR